MDETQPEPLPCAEKLVFETREAANATANVTAYRYGTKVRPYRCRHCGLWHLSSS